MAAKIGILGESVVVAEGTITVYTVPADKAARIRVIFASEGSGTGSYYNIMIGAPGSEITLHLQPGADNDRFSGVIPVASPNPALSLVASVSGIQDDSSGAFDLDSLTTNLANWLRVPLPFDYFLSTGDTVKFNVGNAPLNDHIIQVLGVEDDA